MIRFKPSSEIDLPELLDLYNYHILNTTATFHLNPLSLNEMRNALPLNHSIYKTFTIYYNHQFCGYCYLNNYRPRQAYDRTAEITLYLKPEYHRKGIGRETLMFLESEAKKTNIKNLLGVITFENTASIVLFEKMAYTKVAHLKNIGEKFGRILDVTIFQKEI
jgi:phosphinothricin acetyltransferase